jgi:hypothetical protein
MHAAVSQPINVLIYLFVEGPKAIPDSLGHSQAPVPRKRLNDTSINTSQFLERISLPKQNPKVMSSTYPVVPSSQAAASPNMDISNFPQCPSFVTCGKCCNIGLAFSCLSSACDEHNGPVLSIDSSCPNAQQYGNGSRSRKKIKAA